MRTYIKINHVREAEKGWTGKAPMRTIFKNKDYLLRTDEDCWVLINKKGRKEIRVFCLGCEKELTSRINQRPRGEKVVIQKRYNDLNSLYSFNNKELGEKLKEGVKHALISVEDCCRVFSSTDEVINGKIRGNWGDQDFSFSYAEGVSVTPLRDIDRKRQQLVKIRSFQGNFKKIKFFYYYRQ